MIISRDFKVYYMIQEVKCNVWKVYKRGSLQCEFSLLMSLSYIHNLQFLQTHCKSRVLASSDAYQLIKPSLGHFFCDII